MSGVLHSLKNSVTGHHEGGGKPSTVHDSKAANKLDPRVNADEANRVAKSKTQNAGKDAGSDAKRTAKDTTKDWKSEATDDVKQGGRSAKDKVTPGTHNKDAASKPEKQAEKSSTSDDLKQGGRDAKEKLTPGARKDTASKAGEQAESGLDGNNRENFKSTGGAPSPKTTGNDAYDDKHGFKGTQASKLGSRTGSTSDNIDSNKSVRGYGGTSGNYDASSTTADGVTDGYDDAGLKTSGRKSTDTHTTGPAGSYVTSDTGNRDSQTAGYGSGKHEHGHHPGIVGRYHIAADDPTVAHHKVDEDLVGNDSGNYDERLGNKSSSRGEGFYNIPPDDMSNVTRSSNTNNLRPDLDQARDVRDLHSQF